MKNAPPEIEHFKRILPYLAMISTPENRGLAGRLIDILFEKFDWDAAKGKRLKTRDLTDLIFQKDDKRNKSRTVNWILTALEQNLPLASIECGGGILDIDFSGKNNCRYAQFFIRKQRHVRETRLELNGSELHQLTDGNCIHWLKRSSSKVPETRSTTSNRETVKPPRALEVVAKIKALEWNENAGKYASFEDSHLRFLKKNPMPKGSYDDLLLGSGPINPQADRSTKSFALDLTPFFYSWPYWFRAENDRLKTLIRNGKVVSPVMRPLMVAVLAETSDGFLISKGDGSIVSAEDRLMFPTLLKGISVPLVDEIEPVNDGSERLFDLEKAVAVMVSDETGIRCRSTDVLFHGLMEIPSPRHFSILGISSSCPCLLATVRFESFEFFGRLRRELLSREIVQLIYENRASRDLLRNYRWRFEPKTNDKKTMVKLTKSPRVHPTLRMLAAILSGDGVTLSCDGGQSAHSAGKYSKRAGAPKGP